MMTGRPELTLVGAVQQRGLTSDFGQYRFRRKENEVFFSYLKRFPILPKDLGLTFVEEWDFGAFMLHKVSYSVEPLLRVFAYLLEPEGARDRRTSCILALHQHNDEYKAGKSEVVGLVRDPRYTKTRAVPPDPNHRPPSIRRQFAYGRELVERGYVVLAPDFIGFEEYRDPDEHYEEPGFLRGFEEMVSEKYLLYGSCLMAKQIHDSYVALSALTSLDFVDASRVGVIGHSLGGHMAAIMAAFDARLRAGVSSCGTLCYRDFEESNRMETADTIIPGFRSEGLDFDFFLDMVPPTPFLSTNGAKELGAGARNILEKRMDNFDILIHEGGHEFPRRARDKAYSFLDRRLA